MMILSPGFIPKLFFRFIRISHKCITCDYSIHESFGIYIKIFPIDLRTRMFICFFIDFPVCQIGFPTGQQKDVSWSDDHVDRCEVIRMLQD